MTLQIYDLASGIYAVAKRSEAGHCPLQMIKEIDLYMKATGIVRRIEARVIITQKCDKAL